MKTVAICVGAAGLAFFLAGFQMGLFDQGAPTGSSGDSEQAALLKKEPKQRPKFPQDLAPTARAEPVAAAAALKTDVASHRMVVLKTTGALHPWHESLADEWQANRVEETEVALIVGVQKKIFIDITHYPNGEPPISRYKHEVEASVVEAKTGKVLANQVFVNVPRRIAAWEAWATTAIGHAVQFKSVFEWAAGRARAGFPDQASPNPLVVVVD